jgi:hypothetical protein
MKPFFSRTRKEAIFQEPTVDHRRFLPVATAASIIADAASVA